MVTQSNVYTIKEGIMYTKIDEQVEKFVRGQGEITFVSSTVGAGSMVVLLTQYAEHEVRYNYHNRDRSDRLGKFYLGCSETSKKYHMGSLSLVRECDPALQIFFLNLVIEKAIGNARNAFARELVIISKERFIVETFLNYGFKIEQVSSPQRGERIIYKGIKCLRQADFGT